jgi:hypothetical protein
MTRTPASAPFTEARKSLTKQEVVRLFRDVERYRQALADCSATFEEWLEICPDLQEEWERFTANGGHHSRRVGTALGRQSLSPPPHATPQAPPIDREPKAPIPAPFEWG